MRKNISSSTFIITLEGIEKIKLKKMTTKQFESLSQMQENIIL